MTRPEQPGGSGRPIGSLGLNFDFEREGGRLAGRKARIRINDNSATGTITVDQFAQSDWQKSAPSDATTRMQETFRPQFHFTAKTCRCCSFSRCIRRPSPA